MKKGVALITTILMASLLTILIGTALFLVSRGIFVTGGEERFVSAIEAAEGGIERGVWQIRRFISGLDNLDPRNFRIGSYDVTVDPEMVTVYQRSGFNLRFAAAYLGLGYSEAGGALGQVFLIASEARHIRGQQGVVEGLRLVPIGTLGGQ
ncbi:MAG: hypothetical protein ABDH37_08560 [Candidatus Hydrothermales bacterium]